MDTRRTYQKSLSNINQTMKYDGIERIVFLRQIVQKLRVSNHAKVLRVCGTNGKGSTITMIEQIFLAGHFNVGTFTSPYLLSPLEQIRINGDQITEQQFLNAKRTVERTVQAMNIDLENDVSEFESWFLIAIQTFIDADVEWMLLECGMGGQLDATNAIDRSDISIFTRIGLDHFKFLGADLKSIATTKAKMIRSNELVINYPDQRPVVNEVLSSICQSRHAALISTDQIEFENVHFDPKQRQYRLNWAGPSETVPLKLNLFGDFQLMNLKMVIAWWQQFNHHFSQTISTKALAQGIANAFILGRFSTYHGWILDGAHNWDAIQEFVSTTNHYFEQQPKIIVVGFLADKEVQRCVLELKHLHNATFITTTPVNKDRQLSANFLHHYFELGQSLQINQNKLLNANTIAEAYALAEQLAKTNSIKMAVGSFYLVKGLLEKIKGM